MKTENAPEKARPEKEKASAALPEKIRVKNSYAGRLGVARAGVVAKTAELGEALVRALLASGDAERAD